MPPQDVAPSRTRHARNLFPIRSLISGAVFMFCCMAFFGLGVFLNQTSRDADRVREILAEDGCTTEARNLMNGLQDDFFALAQDQRLAQDYLQQCEQLDIALDTATPPDDRYAAFATFANAPDTLLADAVVAGLASFATTANAADFATPARCTPLENMEPVALAQLAEADLLVSEEPMVPDFLTACGLIYQQRGEAATAFAIYRHVIDTYPDASATAQSAIPATYLGAVQAIAERAANFDQAAYEAQFEAFFNAHVDDTAEDVAAQQAALRRDFRDDNPTQNDLYTSAIALLEEFLTEYPDDERARAAQDLLAELIVAQADALGAAQRSQTAGTPNPAGGTQLVIQNGTAFPLRVTVLGADERLVQTLPGCPACRRQDIATACALEGDDAVREAFHLPAGAYAVVLTVNARDVVVLRGAWQLEPDTIYTECVFVDIEDPVPNNRPR